MEQISYFFLLVEAFRAARRVSDSRVSTLVFNDGQRIANLRGGTDIGCRRLERAIQWMSDNWPEGAAWPAGVPRPAVSLLSEQIDSTEAA